MVYLSYMTSIDIFFIVALLIFSAWGWKRGVIRSLVGLLGSVVAIFLASRYFEVVADFIARKAGWEGDIMRFLSFALGFVVVAIITKFVFKIFEKLLRALSNFPLWGMSDKIFGIFFGLVEGVLIISAFVYIAERFPIHDGLMIALAGSTLGPYLSVVPDLLGPLLPEALHIMDSVVDYVEGVIIR
jgi:membrane protein required for colicin V production